jgi:hypothetical protein
MSRRRRLNEMTFCVCHHGQGAHRNGTGPCFGERRIAGTWIPCKCNGFERESNTDAEVEAVTEDYQAFTNVDVAGENCGGSDN